jgi:hypothetical protein
MRSLIAALVAALILSVPLVASAQVPSYADPGDNGGGSGDAQIRGRILSFDGGYSVQVRDDKGYVDNVQLHPGTIINPTGITLAPGMVVSILGYNQGSSFAANEVDTPYTYYAGSPYYLGHPWNYYGPSVGLSFYFGNTGWWHGNAFAGGSYHYNGGARVYSNVQVNTVYHGGAYQGRTYAAPAEHGGYYAHSSSQAQAHYSGGGGHAGGGYDHH